MEESVGHHIPIYQAREISALGSYSHRAGLELSAAAVTARYTPECSSRPDPDLVEVILGGIVTLLNSAVSVHQAGVE
jgi:hypothetical protein